MRTEEKAKAYDRALEKAKGIITYYKERNRNEASIEDLEEIFPELKESEDERIRKALIKYFSEGMEYLSLIPYNKEQCVSWLEKQGEVKLKKVPIWKHWKDGIAGNGEGTPVYLIKDGYTYSLSSCLGFECDYIELSELDNLFSEKQCEQKPTIEMISAEESLGIDSATYNKIVDECIYGEQKPAELPKGEDYGIDGLWHAIRILQITLGEVEGYQSDDGILEHECAISAVKELCGRKPAWSEDDESRMDNLCHFLEEYGNQYYGHLTLQCTISWLKSLKERVLPQPKQEWSEEYERNLKGIIDEIEANKNQAPDYDLATYDRFLSWLKSLRRQSSY